MWEVRQEKVFRTTRGEHKQRLAIRLEEHAVEDKSLAPPHTNKTMTNNIEIVRKAVIAAVPEIMGLSFGCQVYAPWRGKTVKHTVVYSDRGSVYVSESRWRGNHTPNVGTTKKYSEANIREWGIIGHPIGIAEVLRAIQQITGTSYTNVTINRWGEFLIDEEMRGEESKGGFYTRVLCQWDLSKDRLEDQSPECIEFLANVLK